MILVVRTECSMKFRLLGQFDPPPGKIRVYFLKSSKGGGKGGKGRGKRFGRGGVE